MKDTTPTHKFIRTLAESGRLLRCYTQNIDGLEGREGLATDLSLGAVNSKKRKRCSLAGVPGEMALSETAEVNDYEKGEVVTAPKRGCQVVQLHGELDTLRCMHCQGTCEYDNDRVAALMGGRAPDCPSCVTKDRERREAGKRGTRVGGLRPNIVLYGEEHPQGDVIGRITSADLKSGPDMMIIFGTSLKVHGLKRLVKEFAASIHARALARKSSTSTSTSTSGEGDEEGEKPTKQEVPRVVFVNNQPAANSVWKDTIDAWVDMDCDEFVAEIKRRRPAVWERQERLEAGFRRVIEGRAGSGKGVFKANPPEESDKENSSKPPTGSSKPVTSTSTTTTTPSKKKKTPLVLTSQSSANTLGTITLATPKHKKTPLPTPPSSISKQKSSGKSNYFTASPSMSPLSSLASTPSPPASPQSFQFECPRLRHALFSSTSTTTEDDDGSEEWRLAKWRRMQGIDGPMNPVQRRLFASTRQRRGNLLQAVVINSPPPPAPGPGPCPGPRPTTPPALLAKSKKGSTTTTATATAAVVQSTITTRSKVTKPAALALALSLSSLESGKRSGEAKAKGNGKGKGKGKGRGNGNGNGKDVDNSNSNNGMGDLLARRRKRRRKRRKTVV